MKDYTIPLPPETLSEELPETPRDSVITSSDLITTDKYAWSVVHNILQQPRIASFHSSAEGIFELHSILWQYRHDYASPESVIVYADEGTQKLVNLFINDCKETLRNIWAIIDDCRNAAVEVGGVQTIVLIGSQREQLDLYVKDIKMWTVYLTETLQRLGRSLLKRSPSMGLESFLLLADKVADAVDYFLRNRNDQHSSQHLDQRGQSAPTCNTRLVSEVIRWSDIMNIFRAAGASKEEIMENKSFIMDFIYRLPILNISGGVKISRIRYNASGNADPFSYVTTKSERIYSSRTDRYGPLRGSDESSLMRKPTTKMAIPTPNSARATPTRPNFVSEKRVRFEDEETELSNSSRLDPEPVGSQHNQYLDPTHAQQYASAQASDYNTSHHHNHIHYHHYHSSPSYQPPVRSNTNPQVLPDAPEAPISPLDSFSGISSSPSSSNQHVTNSINDYSMYSGIQMRHGYLESIKKEWEQLSRMRNTYTMCPPLALEQLGSSSKETDDARKERERQERARKIEKERGERMRHCRMSNGGGGGCGDNDSVCYW